MRKMSEPTESDYINWNEQNEYRDESPEDETSESYLDSEDIPLIADAIMEVVTDGNVSTKKGVNAIRNKVVSILRQYDSAK